ncbi:hypothetical protein [Dactylosporangium sp. CA-139066]|uniref:hypothetical protein n=1 Tax=Dactylosporangium sp. CA-139066 TaxID=3239930 RepID=UPI003D8AC0EB
MSDVAKVKVVEDTALTTYVTEVTGAAEAYWEVPRGLLEAYETHEAAAHEALQELLEYLRTAPVVNPMDEYGR